MNFTSKQYSKYNTNNNRSPKPFCPICKKNGRPEAEYNSHFIRATSDENSAITCPILLDMECCTAGTQQEIDRFLDERHNNYVQRRDNVFIRNDTRNDTRYDTRNDTRYDTRNDTRYDTRNQVQIPHIQIPQPIIEEDNFPSLSKKPVKTIESVKGYANIATIAAPLAAPKPVLKKPVAKPVEEEYETDDDDDVNDDDSVYSSKIPDDDNW